MWAPGKWESEGVSERGGRLEGSEAAEGGVGALRLGGGRVKEESVPTRSDL